MNIRLRHVSIAAISIALALSLSYYIYRSITDIPGVDDPTHDPPSLDVEIYEADILFLLEHTSRVRVNSDVQNSGEYYPTMLQTIENWITNKHITKNSEYLSTANFALLVYDARIDFEVTFNQTLTEFFSTLDQIWESTPSTGFERMDYAMQEAINRFATSTREKKYIILIGDGRQSTSSPSLVDQNQIINIRYEIVPEANNQGIQFHTYGFPSYRYTINYNGDPNYDFMEDIASISGGIYVRGNDNDELTDFLNRIQNL